MQTRVPDSDGELSVEILQTVGAVILIEMQDSLGVAVRREAVPASLQLRAQFDVVEDFAIEDDPQRPVLIPDRLLAAAEIDDAQARASQADPRVTIDSEFVGTPVPDHCQHLSQGFFRHRCWLLQACHADNATHICVSLSSQLVVRRRSSNNWWL